ncbi:large ribosomal subunit protein eL37-like [Magnolia sinica]|uniref:large ribosomal subunit protein eL37-like n=1 Tax=Magnolia sinica TaxID=86752 RepID=UPI00265AC76E|nr:large ribosomal subunit protein eL37-like [Magnolia sinica]
MFLLSRSKGATEKNTVSSKPNMGKGREALGREGTRHTLCVRCGRRSFHLQKSQCASCAYPASRIRKYNWSVKAITRKTTGMGRMRYLHHVPQRFKCNFREGSQAAPRKTTAAA